MGYLFREYISDEIVQEKFRDKYGKKYKLKLDIQYQVQYKSAKIDVGFTQDKKAFWIFKYKDDYYMNIIEELEEKDKYSLIDVYTTLVTNAQDTHNHLTGLAKAKRDVLAKKK